MLQSDLQSLHLKYSVYIFDLQILKAFHAVSEPGSYINYCFYEARII